jgi:hypothetical protein
MRHRQCSTRLACPGHYLPKSRSCSIWFASRWSDQSRLALPRGPSQAHLTGRALDVPPKQRFTAVAHGHQRSPVEVSGLGNRRITSSPTLLPKLAVRVRFPSPAPPEAAGQDPASAGRSFAVDTRASTCSPQHVNPTPRPSEYPLRPRAAEPTVPWLPGARSTWSRISRGGKHHVRLAARCRRPP